MSDAAADPGARVGRWDRAVLAVSGIAAVACVGWFVIAAFLPAGAILNSWLLAPFCATLATIAAWRAATDPRLPATARRFWRQLGFGLAAVAVSMVSRIADALNSDLTLTPRISPLTGVLHAVSIAMLAWPILRLPSGARTLTQRTFVWLDLAALTLASSVFAWHFTMRPMIAEGVPAAAAGAIGAAITGCAVTAVLLMSRTGGSSLRRASLVLLGVALATGGLSPSLRPLLGTLSYVDASLIGIPIAAFFVCLSAHAQRTAERAHAEQPAEDGHTVNVLPYLAIGATDLLLLLTLPGDSLRDRVLVGVVTVVLTVVVVVRQVIALRDNEGLLARLNDGLRELRDHEQRFRILVQNSYDVVTISQPDGHIDYMSGGSQRMFGRTPDQRKGGNMLELVHPDDKERVRGYFWELADTPGSSLLYQIRFQHADGSWRWIEILSTNLLHEPTVNGILSNTRDVTDARELQDRLAYEATHDVLTGLANRALFNQRVADSAGRDEHGHRMSIVLIDLDNFKTVNDMLGHTVGDALLVTVADRMRQAIRPGDTVARLGGDEFAILLEGIVAVDVDRVIQRMVAALREPVLVEGHSLSAQASFGVVDGAGGDHPGDLLRHADIAMYEAKAQGDGGWVHYRPGMEPRGADRSRQAAELRAALDNGDLVLLYQPVVALPGGGLTGVEALVRWQHAERGLVPPVEFIPLAEATGLIVPLGNWVLREACRQAAEWLTEFGNRAPATIAVNVSARQLQEARFAEDVMAALLSSGLEASRLVIEITESTAVGGGSTHETLRRLRELGVRVALDDFGTGQSTLTLLANCPVDQIKLDRSFVPAPGPDVIATAVVQLARALSLDVVAEGVETAEQATWLHSLGYGHAQGYHFARPLAAEAIGAAIADITVLDLRTA
ncbi:MAG: putative diguanylate cyclase/phosphodiesterase with sensor [Actinomycetia bacterium]|nr:putative diguanylate cyclase/phosphodiesterase with sensor [Actinomycetes bacterium]